MRVSARDGWAAVFTILAVLAYVATDQGWNVWLVGSSHRWAAGVIGVLGVAGCSLGKPGADSMTAVMSVLGVATLAALIVALLTGSLGAVAVLVLLTVVLWVASTLRHLGSGITSGSRT